MIYLDNCATTKIRKEVFEKMYESYNDDFGNPSSLHRLGLKSEKKVKKSREIIADYLKVDSKEIFFTSGGTESNNIAIQSIINSNLRKGNHIITTKIEHPSVLNVMKSYEEKGLKVTYIDVDQYGILDMEQLENSINEETILISIIHVPLFHSGSSGQKLRAATAAAYYGTKKILSLLSLSKTME